MVTRAAKKRWLYDRKSGRWRHGGTFSSKPPRSALRKNKAGHYIDDAGRRVPDSALAPVRSKKPKKAAKPKKPASKRKKPKTLKKAKSPVKPKHLRMLRGGLAESFRQAIKETEEEYGRGKPQTIPEITRITRGETIVDKEFVSSSFVNRKRPENLADIHDGMLERAASKGPFQPDDIVVYDHGLKYVGHEKLDANILAKLQGMVPTGGTIRYADTKAGTEVYVSLGKDPKIGGQTGDSFKQAESSLQDIYDALLDYWDSLDWYEWFETDESLYG